MTQEFGEIEKVQQKSYEETQIEWRIHDFLSVVEKIRYVHEYVDSPHFSIADDSTLYFRLYRNSFGYILLYFKSVEKLKYSVGNKFGLKKSDGSMLNFAPVILQRDGDTSNGIEPIKLSELRSRKSELLPANVLTLTCKLKREITYPIQPNAVEEKKSLKLIRLDRLSENFQDLLCNTETCDTTLKVKNTDYKAHRSVLIARSPVFAATFKHDTSERQTGVITIPDCDPDSFQGFLEYLYCGRLEGISFQDALSLYVTSDKYGVLELKEFCIEYLTQSLTLENVCEIVVFADQYNETLLLSAAQEFFMKNGFEILLTSKWENLMKRDYRLANKLLTEFSKASLKQRVPK